SPPQAGAATPWSAPCPPPLPADIGAGLSSCSLPIEPTHPATSNSVARHADRAIPFIGMGELQRVGLTSAANIGADLVWPRGAGTTDWLLPATREILRLTAALRCDCRK